MIIVMVEVKVYLRSEATTNAQRCQWIAQQLEIQQLLRGDSGHLARRLTGLEAGSGALELEQVRIVVFLHLINEVQLGVVQELVRRSHLDNTGPLQTKVVLITELQLPGQQRFSVLGAGTLEQRVEVSEGMLGVELEEVHRGNSLDGGHNPGDAVGLRESEERGDVVSDDDGEDALLDRGLHSAQRLRDGLQRRSGRVQGAGQGDRSQELDVGRALDVDVVVGRGGRGQDVLWRRNGVGVEQRSAGQ